MTNSPDIGFSAQFPLRLFLYSMALAYALTPSLAKSADPNTASKVGAAGSEVIVIQAEDYDEGKNGTAYYDTTPENSGGSHRTDDVDIEECWEGGYNIAWVKQGEWWRYSNVESAGGPRYVDIRVAAAKNGGTMSLEINDKTSTSGVFIEPTGGYQTWATVSLGVVELRKGSNKIRIVSESAGWNLDWIAFRANQDLPLPQPDPKVVAEKAKARQKKKDGLVLLTVAPEAIEIGQNAGLGDSLDVVDKLVAADDQLDGNDKDRFLILTRSSVADQLTSAGAAIESSTTHIPYKYRLDGFIERKRQPYPVRRDGRAIFDDGYHDPEMVEALLRAIETDFPNIAELQSIGKTRQGRDIWALRLTKNVQEPNDKPAFLFNSAHHGSELMSIEHTLDIIDYLTSSGGDDQHVDRWLTEYEIWCIPIVNPDGVHRYFHQTGSGRKNGRDTNNNGEVDPADGVDLNRNYPFRWHTLGEKGSKSDPEHSWYRGEEPASEPEVRSIMALAERERFVGDITYHTAATKVLVPYTIDDVKNPEPSAAWSLGEEMANLSDSARDDKDYKAQRNLYSVDGTDQDWLYHEYGTLAYIWEGPLHNPDYGKKRDAIVIGARPGWMAMLDRLLDGPSISGVVHDAKTGNPLEAVVRIEEVTWRENEVHTSHPQSGRFDRILTKPGVYHVIVEKDGYAPERREVEVAEERAVVEIELSPDPGRN